MKAELFLEKLYGRKDIPVREDLTELFLWALDNLSENVQSYYIGNSFKECTKMYFYGGYTLEAIGKAYDLSKERVRQRILRVLNALRSYYDDLFIIGLHDYRLKIKAKNVYLEKVKSDAKSIPLEEGEDFPKSLYNILKRAGFSDFSQVYSAYIDGTLLSIKGLGSKGYDCVISFLKEYGYDMKGGKVK